MDSMVVMIPVPTFACFGAYNEALAHCVDELSRAEGGKVRAVSWSVGKRGWETSMNQGEAKTRKARFDASKNMEPAEWFKKLTDDTKVKDAGLSFEMINQHGPIDQVEGWPEDIVKGDLRDINEPPRKMTKRGLLFPIAEEMTKNVLEARKGVPKNGSLAIWVTAAFEAWPAMESTVQTVKNVRNNIDYIVWMDTNKLLPTLGMEKSRQRVRKLVELCGKDKIVIQVGVFNKNFSLYPNKFMKMCREEGVTTFLFGCWNMSVLQTSEWRNLVMSLP